MIHKADGLCVIPKIIIKLEGDPIPSIKSNKLQVPLYPQTLLSPVTSEELLNIDYNYRAKTKRGMLKNKV